MPGPDLTSEALKRLCETLRAQATEFKGFAENAMMLDSPVTASCYDHRRGTQEEAAAAISALMAERDALRKELQAMQWPLGPTPDAFG